MVTEPTLPALAQQVCRCVCVPSSPPSDTLWSNKAFSCSAYSGNFLLDTRKYDFTEMHIQTSALTRLEFCVNTEFVG